MSSEMALFGWLLFRSWNLCSSLAEMQILRWSSHLHLLSGWLHTHFHQGLRVGLNRLLGSKKTQNEDQTLLVKICHHSWILFLGHHLLLWHQCPTELAMIAHRIPNLGQLSSRNLSGGGLDGVQTCTGYQRSGMRQLILSSSYRKGFHHLECWRSNAPSSPHWHSQIQSPRSRWNHSLGCRTKPAFLIWYCYPSVDQDRTCPIRKGGDLILKGSRQVRASRRRRPCL